MRNKRFLIELSVVLFVLGLIFSGRARLSSVGELRRTESSAACDGSEEADLALPEKRETRLVIDSAAGTYQLIAGDKREVRRIWRAVDGHDPHEGGSPLISSRDPYLPEEGPRPGFFRQRTEGFTTGRQNQPGRRIRDSFPAR
jgi:hypothetical protein